METLVEEMTNPVTSAEAADANATEPEAPVETEEDPDEPQEKYEGDVQGNERHGFGTLHYANGDRYAGQWVQNRREGFGALTLGWNSEEKYQGQWVNDMKEGMGSYSWRTGEHFEGTYKDGVRVEGRYQHNMGERTHFGNWENDCPCDQGSLQSEEGVYTGGLHVNRLTSPAYQCARYMVTKHKRGVMIYKNGSRYKGFWHNDVKEGYGIYVSEEYTYHGNWKVNKMNGSGTLLYPDGTYYDGMFVYGLKNGPGILYMPNGDKIEGEFVNNQIGKATFTKGAFTPVSRPVKTMIMSYVRTPMKEKGSIECTQKWSMYFKKLVLNKDNPVWTSEEVLDYIKDDYSSATKMWTFFAEYFNNQYSLPRFTQELNLKQSKLTLSFAVDDLYSFTDGLMDELCRIAKYEIGIDDQKVIYSIITAKLTKLIYDTIFPLYRQAYRKKDALFVAKCTELKHLSHFDIGINKKYCLVSEKEDKIERDPYFLVIKSIRDLAKLKTPEDKMNALVCASNGILLTVNKHKSTSDEKGVAMGAEDKFPVLIHSVIRACVPLYSHYHYMNDLIHDHLSDPEAIYRVEELLSVIKYVFTLDLHMRDKSETLLPYNLMEKNVKWELIKTIEIVPDADKASVVYLLITTLNILSKKATYLEPSFSLSSSLNDHQREIISKHCKFFSYIFELLGLTIAVSHSKEPQGEKSESKKEEFSLSSLIGITIGFTLKYDLSIYARVAAGITEFYLDREFVRTGKWDRPIYV